MRKGVGGTCPARAAARSPALRPLLTALAVTPGNLATTASPHRPAGTKGHVRDALEQDRQRHPQPAQQRQQAQHAQHAQHAQQTEHAQKDQHVQHSQHTQQAQQRPEQIQWQQQQHESQQLAQPAVQQGNHSGHCGISSQPSTTMPPFNRTNLCLATPSCPHYLSSYADSVPSPASATTPNSADPTIPVPAVEETSDGPWSANRDTAGNAGAFVGAVSAVPNCAADHTAVAVAADAAFYTTTADDKGFSDVRQAASSAAAAGQVQAGVQLDGEHGDDEEGQDAELHDVNSATG